MEMDKETLNDLYWNQRLSTLVIGKIFNVSSTTIGLKMKGLGLTLRKPGEYLKGHHMSEEGKRKISEAQLGPKSNNWKGGRSIDAHGYVRVSIPYDNPYAEMSHKTKSRRRARDITEHRLVMAQHLGRCLFPWEIVHHVNGIKTDNRIENLKLMSGLSEHMPSSNWQRYIEQIKSESYEQGKKDLLEALRKQGIHGLFGDKVEGAHSLGDIMGDGRLGTLVFIPDDE